MGKSRNWFALATSAAAIGALAVTASVSAGNDAATRTCPQKQLAAASTSPELMESSLLKQFISDGWLPTAAGEQVLAGQLPAAQGNASVGYVEGGAQLAVAPAPTVRGKQSVTSVAPAAAAAATVFLFCGVGQRGNVNFYEAAGTYAWVSWELHNFATGAIKHVRSIGTNYCPARSGGCLEYFWIRPAGPWFVWGATEQTVASPLNEYCSP